MTAERVELPPTWGTKQESPTGTVTSSLIQATASVIEHWVGRKRPKTSSRLESFFRLINSKHPPERQKSGFDSFKTFCMTLFSLLLHLIKQSLCCCARVGRAEETSSCWWCRGYQPAWSELLVKHTPDKYQCKSVASFTPYSMTGVTADKVPTIDNENITSKLTGLPL